MSGQADETREQKRERQTAEIYAALGRYVAAFELLVDAIRRGCLFLTARDNAQQRLMQIVFCHRSMTADNLFRIYRAIIGEIVNDTESKIPADEKLAILGVLQKFDQDFQRASAQRNDLLHGTWFVGWGNQSTEDWSEIGYLRLKATNNGLAVLPGPNSAQDVDAHTRECHRLSEIFGRFDGCFLLNRMGKGPTRVSANFVNAGTSKTPNWQIRRRKS